MRHSATHSATQRYTVLNTTLRTMLTHPPSCSGQRAADTGHRTADSGQWTAALTSEAMLTVILDMSRGRPSPRPEEGAERAAG